MNAPAPGGQDKRRAEWLGAAPKVGISVRKLWALVPIHLST